MQIPRRRQRSQVEIAVVITTVLESLEGIIVDLSEGGAQIRGCSLPARSQCQIDLDGHVVFGTVQWSEADRMGVRFPYELAEGPLFDRLEMARGARRTSTTVSPRPPMFQSTPSIGGFGRRTS